MNWTKTLSHLDSTPLVFFYHQQVNDTFYTVFTTDSTSEGTALSFKTNKGSKTIYHYPYWYNSKIIHAINCMHTARKQSKTPSNLLKIQALESHLSSLISTAKSSNLSTQPASKIFSYIRSFLPSSSVPPIVSLDSHTGSSNYEKATLFNNFFHSVFTHSSFQIPPLESLPTPVSTLSDIGISEMDVYEAPSSLDTTKASGPDGIGPKVFAHCGSALYSPLHHLFLLCLSQHHLPSEWREHLIVPVFKSGDMSSVKNYRPYAQLRNSWKSSFKIR